MRIRKFLPKPRKKLDSSLLPRAKIANRKILIETNKEPDLKTAIKLLIKC